MEGQRPRCPHAAPAQGRRDRRHSTNNGGATPSLPFYPACIRQPATAAFQNMEGQRPRCPHAAPAQGRRDRRHSTNNGGATPSLPFYPACITPSATAALHKKMEGQRLRCPFTPRASRRRPRRPSRKKWRGNGLVALMLRPHKAAGIGDIPQIMEGQRPRCPFTPRASGHRPRRPSTKKWRGNGLVALMLRPHKAAGIGDIPQIMEGQRPRCPFTPRTRPPTTAALHKK